MKLSVAIHTDGDNEPFGQIEIVEQWRLTWNTYYSELAELEFRVGLNLKQTTSHGDIAPHLKRIADVRNPDLYFVEVSQGIELGGIEITTHSPDGSNVEKRYPYIWISRREGVSAFVVCPYLKRRPQGQANKLPYRHANQNELFLKQWNPLDDGNQSIYQIVPLLELQIHQHELASTEIMSSLLSWTDFGDYFAHHLASVIFAGDKAASARRHLDEFRQKLLKLVRLCKENADHTDPSTLLKLNDKWIQIYNSRPDSGHWERGEGQFDSIDGRLMFTLDGISFLLPDERPRQFEFWLPQMTTKHPWIREQIERGYGSKRLRNILVVLEKYCKTKFADELDTDDWKILRNNSRLLLERLDWSPGVYHVADLVPANMRRNISVVGLNNQTESRTSEILQLLNDENLFFSTHRAYIKDWQSSLIQRLQKIPRHGQVIVPRIPEALLRDVSQHVACRVIGAEGCTKGHLLMLRQLHKTYKNKIDEYGV